MTLQARSTFDAQRFFFFLSLNLKIVEANVLKIVGTNCCTFVQLYEYHLQLIISNYIIL